MNMEFKKYGDFDNPLDLEDMIYYEDDVSDLMMHLNPNYINEIELDETTYNALKN